MKIKRKKELRQILKANLDTTLVLQWLNVDANGNWSFDKDKSGNGTLWIYHVIDNNQPRDEQNIDKKITKLFKYLEN